MAPIAKIRRMIGQDVLLLPWPKGSKGTKRRWKHLTIAAMLDPKYLAKLNRAANIGVVLGKVSGGLCSIDIDDEELVEPFLKLNPFLAGTLRTKGARGCNFWVRLLGDYPRKFGIKANGNPAGEFRSFPNSQTIIHGTHPDEMNYRILNEAPPIEITFDQLTFPVGTRTERTERTEENRRDVPPVGGRYISLRELLLETKPVRLHNNHHLLFTLARGIKTLEAQRSEPYTRNELREVFNQWYAAALPYVRENLAAEDYFLELLELYDYADTPLGSGVVESAFLQAQSAPYPPESEQFEGSDFKLLVAFCWHLQQQTGGDSFYLSCRTVQRLFGLETHAQAARRLRGLVRFGVLEVTGKGGPKTNRATRFNFVGINNNNDKQQKPTNHRRNKNGL
jgi:hypothetical protein